MRTKTSVLSYLVTASLGLCVPLQANAWGSDGHKTVGAIADQLLAGTPTETKVKPFLKPGETLSSVSIWADCAKGFRYCQKPPTQEMKDFATANPDHHGYHYTDVPIDEPVYQTGGVGTTDHDVVVTVTQAAAALRGDTSTAANPHQFTPRQALLLLAHLVGDIHQPLHVGAIYLTRDGVSKNPTAADLQTGTVLDTQGGNKLHINGKTQVLHSYWDSDAVKVLMRRKTADSPEALAQILLTANPRPTPLSTDIAGDIKNWADGSLEASRIAFHGTGISPFQTDLPGSEGNTEGWAITLPATYPQVASDIAAERLLLAGKRLAALLQAVLK